MNASFDTSAVGLSWLVWLADVSLKGLAIIALAALVSLSMRRASAASRHLVWCLAVCSLLVLPVLSAILPGWQVPFLPRLDVRAKLQTSVTEAVRSERRLPQPSPPPAETTDP